VWFDPALVRALEAVSSSRPFWERLASPTIEARVVRMGPRDQPYARRGLPRRYADAFGQVIDAKSPFTAGHSQRVGALSERMAGKLGMSLQRARWLRRAAVLHDVGKLGVSSAILEKPSGLDDREWVEMRGHATHTRAILGRIGALADMADVAAAHHERLRKREKTPAGEGRGSPSCRLLCAQGQPLKVRLLAREGPGFRELGLGAAGDGALAGDGDLDAGRVLGAGDAAAIGPV
jgi:putative nucleotidyltransferase with HDIG domain